MPDFADLFTAERMPWFIAAFLILATKAMEVYSANRKSKTEEVQSSTNQFTAQVDAAGRLVTSAGDFVDDVLKRLSELETKVAEKDQVIIDQIKNYQTLQSSYTSLQASYLTLQNQTAERLKELEDRTKQQAQELEDVWSGVDKLTKQITELGQEPIFPPKKRTRKS